METNQIKILLVDDSTENIDILGGLLSDYKRMVALNGKKALEIIESGKLPDLILLDIEMPGIDGFEVCKQIRAQKKYNDIPIIFLTAKTDKESMLKGFELGGQDYVTKPFDRNVLMARVKTHVELKKKREELENINTALEKKIEERTLQLQMANEKLLAINWAKAEFVKMISAELRTPIQGLLMPLKLMKDHSETEEMINLVNSMEESVSKLEDFSETASLISLIESNEYELEKQPVNLLELIEFSLLGLSSIMNEKNIEITKENIKQDLNIEADYKLLKESFEKLMQIIINALSENSKLILNIYSDNDEIHCSLGFQAEQMDDSIIEKLSEKAVSEFLSIDMISFDIHLIRATLDLHQMEMKTSITENGLIDIVQR